LKQRQRVSVYTQKRPDGKPSFIVAWAPTPGDRQRRCFSNEREAEAEADRIEVLLQRGLAAVTYIPKRHLAEIGAFWAQKPDSVTGNDIIRFWIEEHRVSETVLVAHAGRAFIESRSDPDKFADRTRSTVRQHINRFIRAFAQSPLNGIKHEHIDMYLTQIIGGVGKTRNQHLITIKSFFRWARDKKQWLPYGKPTAPELVDAPRITRTEHTVYTPEEFTRILVFTPADMLMFMVLGQFAGIRTEERLRLQWHHWRDGEDGKIVLNEEITKTNKRRRVDVMPNLAIWLAAFRGAPEDYIVAERDPFRLTKKMFGLAGVERRPNALRAGYASYHLELFDNAALTAKNDGHTVQELETSYRSINGITKAKAQEMFNITPQSVLDYARQHNLPQPNWASKILEICVA
jgi:integrase